MRRGSSLLLFAFFAAFAGACRNEPGAPPRVSGVAAGAGPAITIVESVPVETPLGADDVADAPDVWLDMVRGAARSIDLAQFYAVSREGSALDRVVVEIERAIARGVRVRLLLDALFHPKYPELGERLARAGAEVREIDLRGPTGGVHHAKYFVVDGREAFVGSQNFDWRALEHIQEIGVRLRDPALVAQLAGLFERDWRARGAADAGAPAAAPWPASGPLRLAASPRGLLPDESAWDLPILVEWIDRARRSVDVQLLTYKPAFRDKRPFSELDDALRRAASRGVNVRLLVSHWATREEAEVAALGRLGAVPGVIVRVIEVPRWSGGDIDFARVAHAKYMVVDGARAWIGTSNWEGDYFYASRNVSLFVDERGAASTLGRTFERGWSASFTRPAPPAPRVSAEKR